VFVPSDIDNTKHVTNNLNLPGMIKKYEFIKLVNTDPNAL